MNATNNNTILRFDNASFAYNDGKKVILDDTSFNIRENTKISIMGQNGAGKSTMFKLIMGELSLDGGKINKDNNIKVAIARQVIPREKMNLTVRERYEETLDEKDYSFDKKINDILAELNFSAPLDKVLKDFSGGQQARLLLGHALIQDPDILLMDEPTNNLDRDGIGDLISFLMMYEKTVVVISHDADFLNMFTDGVLYLNVMKHTVEQYR
jgi:ATPase subunit of ABC transporter with duplicated ATPase domains